MAQGSAQAEGMYLRGSLRGGAVVPGRERADGSRFPDSYRLHLEVGGEVVRIEYAAEADARAAVTAEAPDAQVGDSVALPVYVRAGARGGAQAFVFYRGRTGGAAEDVTW